MTNMKIQPLGNSIQLDIEEATAGALDTSSRDTAIEYGKVLAIGNEPAYPEIKVGYHVFVKAWAIDIINHEGKKYYFVNTETNGILAIVK